MASENLKLAQVNELKSVIGKERISILGITETSDRIDENLINIPDFHFFRADRGSRGGGVGAYVRSSLKASCIKLDQLASLGVHGLKIIVGILYRPPNYKNVHASINMIDSCLQEVRPKCDEVILLGDLNINLLNQSNHSQMLNDVLEISLKLLLILLGKLVVLDIIAISNTKMVQSGVVHFNMHEISDHQLTVCALSLKHQKQPTIFKTFRNFKSFNLDAFQADLLLLDWRDLYIAGHITNKVEILNNKLLHIFV
nr:unnamed protein product [Callosobruchus analis]